MLSRTRGGRNATCDEIWGGREGSGWSSELGLSKPGFRTQFCHSLNLWPWASQFLLSGLSFSLSELRERDKNQRFKHSGNPRGRWVTRMGELVYVREWCTVSNLEGDVSKLKALNFRNQDFTNQNRSAEQFRPQNHQFVAFRKSFEVPSCCNILPYNCLSSKAHLKSVPSK